MSKYSEKKEWHLKFLISFILFFSFSFGAYVQQDVWWKGESLLTFFEKHNIPQKVYFDLPRTDKELCSEIYAGVEFQTMFDDDGAIVQTLIPISEQMQIHVYKDDTGQFVLDIIPISFQEFEQNIQVSIQNSPYQDIMEATNNQALANEFMLAFKNSVDFRRLQKNDTISIKFKQKIRHGKYFGSPEILAASVKMKRKTYYIFQNPDDKRYYDLNGNSLTSFLLKTPLTYTRISSKFTYKRFHPILKRYRPHLGVDFAAPTGRKIYAAADGRVIHKGNKGGYGKTIIIRHSDGLRTLYAHLSRYNTAIKVGSWVKQGRYIARVGSTGRSTGPHLHFGLYKNGKAIDPLKMISVTKTKLEGEKRKDFMKVATTLKDQLDNGEKYATAPIRLENFETSYQI
jgi:murein DD-endopeptidase MepM/ murein hydrolase activator NlpD